MTTAVAVVSGGLDSVTLAYWLANEGYGLRLVSFDYGQRHGTRELAFARECATNIRALSHTVVDLRSMRELFPGSALTDERVDVPHAHYSAEVTKQTVVPNRNATMLAVAYGHAVAVGATACAYGAQGGRDTIYPDCRPEFVSALGHAFSLGNHGFGDPSLALLAPFIEFTKAEIVSLGARLNVPFAATWSCYEGGEAHCGECGTCVKRREAFAVASVVDPTLYVRR